MGVQAYGRMVVGESVVDGHVKEVGFHVLIEETLDVVVIEA